MGIGYSEDLVVCAALGVDHFDCVFPTRTARFGRALTRRGRINLKSGMFLGDFGPIDPDCSCPTCIKYSRSYVHQLFTAKETLGCHLITQHNIAYQMRLMKDIRESILQDRFPDFVREFMFNFYKNPWPFNVSFSCSSARDSTRHKKRKTDGPVEEEEDTSREKDQVDPETGYPQWIVNALDSVGISLATP